MRSLEYHGERQYYSPERTACARIPDSGPDLPGPAAAREFGSRHQPHRGPGAVLRRRRGRAAAAGVAHSAPARRRPGLYRAPEPRRVRFTVTQASKGDWPDLLGYTQSAARLPAFARGALKTGVQATVDDALTFPFTPQQRKMLWYGGLRGTVLTPIRPAARGSAPWSSTCSRRSGLGFCARGLRSLAEAIGARLALAKLGDHLVSDERDPLYDTQRLNVLANIAHLLDSSNDPSETTAQIVDALGGLHWVRSARSAPVDDATKPSSRRRPARGWSSRTSTGSPTSGWR